MRTRRRAQLSVALLLIIATGTTRGLRAQAPVPDLQLMNRRGERLRTQVMNPNSVRELSDGRVLISDGHPTLMVGDFRTGSITATSIQNVSTRAILYPVNGDTILSRVGAGWTLMAASTSLRNDVPLLQHLNEIRKINGVSVQHAVLTIGELTIDDSSALTLIAPDGTRQLITRLWTKPRNGKTWPTLQVSESAILAPDGWIAVLRMSPFRVDWRDPSGTWTLGTPPDIAIFPMDSSQKQEIIKRDVRRRRIAPTTISAVRDWPDIVEPVEGDGQLMIAPNDDVAVLRYPNAYDIGEVYDIFDRKGNVVREIELNAGDRIVGFGKQYVYVAIRQGGEPRWLERLRW